MGEKYLKVDKRTVDQALAEIREDVSRIKTFSIMYLRKNRVVLDEAIKIAFEGTYEDADMREVLNSIPEALIKDEYRKVLSYVSKNGMKLAIVPLYLQELYLEIPMEAVRNDPDAIEFVSKRALEMFPDIEKLVNR